MYNRMMDHKWIWISRMAVFAVIAGLSFIHGLGIDSIERRYDPGYLDTLPYNYTFWVFNKFLWFPMSFFSGFEGYPWKGALYEWGLPFGLTVFWWIFLSFVIVAAGNYLLKRFVLKKSQIEPMV